MEKSVKKGQNSKTSFSTESVKSFFKNNKRIVLAGAVLLANYLLFITHYLDSSQRSQHILLLSYKDVGFGGRALWGSVLSLLGFSCGSGSSQITSINIFLSVVYFAVCALFFVFITTAFKKESSLKKSRGKAKIPEAFIIVFCACPFFLYAFSYEFFGSVNSFLLILLLVCFLLMRNQKFLPAVPFICAAAIFIDQTFALIYLPAICFVLWYKSKSPNKKPYKKAYESTILISLPLFIIMILLSLKRDFEGINYGSSEILYAKDFHFIQDILQIFKTEKEIAFNELIRFVFILPAVAFLIYLWIRCIKLSDKNEKTVYVLSLAQLCTLLVPLIYFKGFSSWTAAVIAAQTALVICFASEKDSAVNGLINKISLCLEKRKLLIFAAAFVFLILVTEILPLLKLPVG